VKFIYNGKTVKYKNLFKETIVKSTKKLDKKWCLSVFKDNAGVTELAPGSKWALAFKAETHNHPCAVEPYGGAETGVGGVIRDILGVGLGAKPVLNTDNFCFGPLGSNKKIPKGYLSPEKIFEGVVEGVRDYGNRMGIPTASGGIYFDEGYVFNPLVYVGCVGIMPKNKIYKKVKKGDLIVAIGGPTGRDGIHGATFSSADIDENTSASAVQIGHAVNEKKTLDVIMKARDLGLYTAITDCGAGGFSSAIGELGEETGASVDLSKALLKDRNIKPWEIWVSESQERMILSVPKNRIKKLREICELENCPFCVLGEFDSEGLRSSTCFKSEKNGRWRRCEEEPSLDGKKRLTVSFGGEKLINMDMAFLHGGIPQFEKLAVYDDKKPVPEIEKNPEGSGAALRKLLADRNVCSRAQVVTQYDHEVQGGTVIKPFCGADSSSPSDSAVIWPRAATGETDNFSGFAVTHGFNHEAGKLSPYKMAFYCVDEAFRNLVCAGADITRVALLDNFCSGNPGNKKILGEFALAAIACHDAALAYGAPFISGKDSFYNQSKVEGKDLSIPLSLLISAMAPVRDVRKAITSDFKEAGNPVYVAGLSEKGLGSSIYARIYNSVNNILPSLDPKRNLKNYLKIMEGIEKGFIVSAHDVSQGGLAASLAEMCFAGLGAEIDLEDMPSEKGITETELLFGEGGSRIILEVDADREAEFIKTLKNCDIAKIGYVNEEPFLEFRRDGGVLLKENVLELKKIWNRELQESK